MIAGTVDAGTTHTLMPRVWEALATVFDPELDRPITELGFVSEVTLDQDGVTTAAVLVQLRLPTYFCAPNFAYLMVADAHDAVAGVPGVSGVEIRLLDHFAAEEINGGVAAAAGFAGAFPRQATGELAELRRTFQRKAHLACLDRAGRRLVQAGWRVEALADARLADLADSPERASLLRRRAALGISEDPVAPLFVDDEGRPIPAGELPVRLRFARTVRVSIDANASTCRGLLHVRYATGEREADAV